MGIEGLLAAVNPLVEDVHIAELQNKRIAIDGYCWLYKAAYGCCVKIGQGRDDKAWIQYCVRIIQMLLNHDIHVVMVFDGNSLPAKESTEVQRRQMKLKMLEKAKAYEREQNHTEARNCYASAVEITPAMAGELIFYLKQHHPQVECIVAPYEADAQLAYLTQINYVDIILSDDSDHIPYGGSRMLFKFNPTTGRGQLVTMNDLFTKANAKFDLRKFDLEMVQNMCIISGCDYVVGRLDKPRSIIRTLLFLAAIVFVE